MWLCHFLPVRLRLCVLSIFASCRLAPPWSVRQVAGGSCSGSAWRFRCSFSLLHVSEISTLLFWRWRCWFVRFGLFWFSKLAFGTCALQWAHVDLAEGPWRKTTSILGGLTGETSSLFCELEKLLAFLWDELLSAVLFHARLCRRVTSNELQQEGAVLHFDPTRGMLGQRLAPLTCSLSPLSCCKKSFSKHQETK